jgi:uncharacterized coiled-coil protein SlyX
MEVGSPEWIEASLARLDELERERAEHEEALETVEDPAALKRHTEAFTRLDAEIKDLYAKLEAVADDSEDDDSEGSDVDTEVPRATVGDDELSAPHMYSTPTPAPPKPQAKPIVHAENPFGSSPSPSGGGGFDAVASMPMSSGDDDLKPSGGGAKWAFLGLLVVAGIGVGGYFVWTDMQAKKASEPTGPAEPEKVIKAKGVPDDTEAPPTAPSGEATISPNANQPTVTSKKKKKDDEDKPNPLKLKGGDGPL